MLEKMLALQNKRKKEGGFTLVELIVVLVILAILAALLIPALTGYIDKAKEKSIVAETRQCVMAAQTLYDEEYGKIALGATAPTIGTGNFTKAKIAELAEVSADCIGDTITADTTSHKIDKLTYTRNGKTCTYNGSSYEVANATTKK